MSGASSSESPTCYRHPGRRTYVRCTRCDRYICGECMRVGPVGHQCAECVREGARAVRQPRTPFGGRQRSATPVVTYTLISLNALVFVMQVTVMGLERQLALWPPAVASGQTYRLVTSAFLHYGAMHLLLNMWALYVVGPPLEMWLGRLRFGALYAVSALGGSVLVYLIAPLNTATAGASGAVFGLFGATFMVARRLHLDRAHRDQLGFHVPRAGDQLAGARRRAGNGCAGGSDLRLRAQGTSELDPGHSDDHRFGCVRRADRLAHSRFARTVRWAPQPELNTSKPIAACLRVSSGNPTRSHLNLPRSRGGAATYRQQALRRTTKWSGRANSES